MRDTEREKERGAETQAEGEAGSTRGARCGTRPWVSRITLQAKGSAKPLGHQSCPRNFFKKNQILKLETTVTKFKNSLEGFSRLEQTEKKNQ